MEMTYCFLFNLAMNIWCMHRKNQYFLGVEILTRCPDGNQIFGNKGEPCHILYKFTFLDIFTCVWADDYLIWQVFTKFGHRRVTLPKQCFSREKSAKRKVQFPFSLVSLLSILETLLAVRYIFLTKKWERTGFSQWKLLWARDHRVGWASIIYPSLFSFHLLTSSQDHSQPLHLFFVLHQFLSWRLSSVVLWLQTAVLSGTLENCVHNWNGMHWKYDMMMKQCAQCFEKSEAFNRNCLWCLSTSQMISSIVFIAQWCLNVGESLSGSVGSASDL